MVSFLINFASKLINMHPHLPLHMVETLDSVLTSDCVQEAVQHCDSDTGAAGCGGGHITRPLVGLRVVPVTRSHVNILKSLLVKHVKFYEINFCVNYKFW